MSIDKTEHLCEYRVIVTHGLILLLCYIVSGNNIIHNKSSSGRIYL